MNARIYLRNWREVLKADRSGLLQKAAVGFRYYHVWSRSLSRTIDSLSEQIPWITFEARRFLEMALTPEMVVFEYGSGGSTLFYARRAKRVVFVEHDEFWFKRVEAALTESGARNCRGILLKPEPTNAQASPSGLASYRSADARYGGMAFRRYASVIDSYQDHSFELISVDGRARPSCLWHALPKVKPGGYLLLDNSERSRYQDAKNLLEEWEMHEFHGPGPFNAYFWGTAIWRRPLF